MLEGLLGKLLFHGRDIEEIKRTNRYIPDISEFNPNAPYLEDFMAMASKDEWDLSNYNTNIGLDKIRQPIAELREFNGRMLEKVRNSFNDYKESGELSKLGKGLAYAVGITVAISPFLIIGVMGCDLSMDTDVDGGDLIEDIPHIDTYEVEVVQEVTDILDTMGEETCQQVIYYADFDGDNYIDINDFIMTCFGADVPNNYITGEFSGTDCDDYNPNTYPGAIELCDEKDNDCNEIVDDIDSSICYNTNEYGSCQGKFTCVGGEILCDSLIPEPEICDNFDNDCDTEIDEDTILEKICGTSEIGECTFGIIYNNCINGIYVGWSECDAVNSLPEECDGKDNNCDGNIDENLGTTTCGLGECEHTIDNCFAGMLKYCFPNQGAIPEVCDGLDNDCDGQIDEGLTLEQVCGSDVGECTYGLISNLCIGGMYLGWSECDSVNSLPEVCDGKDNDCDNEIDEELGTTTCGVGECEHIVDNCDNGEKQECDPLYNVGIEECDGLDNDCDLEIDEDLTLEQVCGETDIGECTYGLISNLCIGGMYLGWSECDAVLPQAEECDELDNDCDLEIDEEGCVPVVCWDKTFGGNGMDKANEIQQTSDGGYIIGGKKSGKAWVFKIDSNGVETNLDETFSGNGDTEFDSIQQTSDGGYVAAGHKDENKLWVSKLNQNGEQEWAIFYDGNLAYSVKQISDGGYIITGNHGGNIPVLKINHEGIEEWNKTFGAGVGQSVIETNDGNYVIAGDDARVFKVSSDGESKLWDYNTYGSGNLRSIIETNDGGLIAAGQTGNNGWVLRLDSEGNKLWDKSYGGNTSDIAFSIFQTNDGGYVVGGAIGIENNDFWIFKLNSEGDQLWQKSYGNGGTDIAYSAQQTTDLGFIIAGYTSTSGGDAWVLKLDLNGELCD
jgi:hypothetical protein